MNGRLTGKTALVTGGTTGIGLASVKRFAAEGARVAFCGRSQTSVDKALSELGDGFLGIVCDVANVDDIRKMMAKIEGTFGSLDIVFANAGITEMKPLADWTPEEFDRIFSVNARGQFFTVQLAAPIMNDGGVVILTGSASTHLGQANVAVYSASKAVAPSFAKNLSAEFLERKIRVCCLTPGVVNTPIFAKGGISEQKLKELSERTPIGRAGHPDEIAAAAVFLASDESSFILGSEIIVDGGKSQL